MQRSVTAYFNTRKRQATDDLRGKAKVLLLDREQPAAFSKNSVTPTSTAAKMTPTIAKSAQLDLSKSEHRRMTPRISRKLFIQEDQTDIRESFARLKNECEAKNVSFEKKGNLSPRKKGHPVKDEHGSNTVEAFQSSSTLDLKIPDLCLDEIQARISNSSRLSELKACIERFKAQDQRLAELNNKSSNDDKTENIPRIKKFDKIQLEIPVSPQKAHRSPAKTPSKFIQISEKVTPQRRLLFQPKQLTPSPVKGSPTKAPAYQRYLSLTESSATTPALPLPYKYRFLAEAFRCMDTVSAMLYNRGETITFKKLKPAIQELLRRDFTVEHLACIKTIYPEAYTICQEKMHSFGSLLKQDKYELVLTPTLPPEEEQNKSEKDGVDTTNVKNSMGPGLLLERRRKFFNILLEKVQDAHEQFLLGLETPMKIAREKIMRWHPEFDVESDCPEIDMAELPKPPTVERVSSAKDVLERARSLYNPNMKVIDRKGVSNKEDKKITDEVDESKTELRTVEGLYKDADVPPSDRGNLTNFVDTPPTTPTTVKSDYLATAFRGIPKALLEKVRARQSARALETITRSPTANREASLYSRLPELTKILRNIFVAEKKSVLTIEFVLSRLDNSFRTKLTANELDEMIRLLCRLLPTWTCIKNVRKVDYLKLDRDADLGKILKRLEILANDKVFPNSR